jgi:hypothetical protein
MCYETRRLLKLNSTSAEIKHISKPEVQPFFLLEYTGNLRIEIGFALKRGYMTTWY